MMQIPDIESLPLLPNMNLTDLPLYSRKLILETAMGMSKVLESLQSTAITDIDRARVLLVYRRFTEIINKEIPLLKKFQNNPGEKPEENSALQKWRVKQLVVATKIKAFEQFSTELYYFHGRYTTLNQIEELLLDLYASLKLTNYSLEILSQSKRLYTQENLNHFVARLEQNLPSVYIHIRTAFDQLQKSSFGKQSRNESAANNLFSVLHLPASDNHSEKYYLISQLCLKPATGYSIIKIVFEIVQQGEQFAILFSHPIACKIVYSGFRNTAATEAMMQLMDPSTRHYARGYYYSSLMKNYILMEIKPGKTLGEMLSYDPNQFTFSQTILICLALSKEVKRIHDQNLIHYDLKEAHVMMTIAPHELSASLIDADDATTYGQQRELRPRLDTMHYQAPETITRDEVIAHPSADIYSLGFVFKNLFTKNKHHPREVPADIFAAITTLYTRMRAEAPQERPNINEIIEYLNRFSYLPTTPFDEIVITLPTPSAADMRVPLAVY